MAATRARMLGAAVLALVVLGAWQLWTLTADWRPTSDPRPAPPPYPATEREPKPPARAERREPPDRRAGAVATFTLDAAEPVAVEPDEADDEEPAA